MVSLLVRLYCCCILLKLPAHLTAAVDELDSKSVKALAIALLNFASIEDLATWIEDSTAG